MVFTLKPGDYINWIAVNMEKTVAACETESTCNVEGELEDTRVAIEDKDCCKEEIVINKIKDYTERVLLQRIIRSIMFAVLTDIVAVVSIIARTTFWLILKTFYTMIAVPTRSANNYLENERALIIGGSSEVGKEIALQLARCNTNRITLWDTDTERLTEVANEINNLKSNSKVFTYTLPSLSKDSVEDTITKMKLEAGDVSVLVNVWDSNADTNENILTAETDSLLNTVQQELTMYTLVRYCITMNKSLVEYINSLITCLGCQSFLTNDDGVTSWLYHYCGTATGIH